MGVERVQVRESKVSWTAVGLAALFTMTAVPAALSALIVLVFTFPAAAFVGIFMGTPLLVMIAVAMLAGGPRTSGVGLGILAGCLVGISYVVWLTSH